MEVLDKVEELLHAAGIDMRTNFVLDYTSLLCHAPGKKFLDWKKNHSLKIHGTNPQISFHTLH